MAEIKVKGLDLLEPGKTVKVSGLELLEVEPERTVQETRELDPDERRLMERRAFSDFRAQELFPEDEEAQRKFQSQTELQQSMQEGAQPALRFTAGLVQGLVDPVQGFLAMVNEKASEGLDVAIAKDLARMRDENRITAVDIQEAKEVRRRFFKAPLPRVDIVRELEKRAVLTEANTIGNISQAMGEISAFLLPFNAASKALGLAALPTISRIGAEGALLSMATLTQMRGQEALTEEKIPLGQYALSMIVSAAAIPIGAGLAKGLDTVVGKLARNPNVGKAIADMIRQPTIGAFFEGVPLTLELAPGGFTAEERKLIFERSVAGAIAFQIANVHGANFEGATLPRTDKGMRSSIELTADAVSELATRGQVSVQTHTRIREMQAEAFVKNLAVPLSGEKPPKQLVPPAELVRAFGISEAKAKELSRLKVEPAEAEQIRLRKAQEAVLLVAEQRGGEAARTHAMYELGLLPEPLRTAYERQLDKLGSDRIQELTDQVPTINEAARQMVETKFGEVMVEGMADVRAMEAELAGAKQRDFAKAEREQLGQETVAAGQEQVRQRRIERGLRRAEARITPRVTKKGAGKVAAEKAKRAREATVAEQRRRGAIESAAKRVAAQAAQGELTEIGRRGEVVTQEGRELSLPSDVSRETRAIDRLRSLEQAEPGISPRRIDEALGTVDSGPDAGRPVRFVADRVTVSESYHIGRRPGESFTEYAERAPDSVFGGAKRKQAFLREMRADERPAARGEQVARLEGSARRKASQVMREARKPRRRKRAVQAQQDRETLGKQAETPEGKKTLDRVDKAGQREEAERQRRLKEMPEPEVDVPTLALGADLPPAKGPSPERQAELRKMRKRHEELLAGAEETPEELFQRTGVRTREELEAAVEQGKLAPQALLSTAERQREAQKLVQAFFGGAEKPPTPEQVAKRIKDAERTVRTVERQLERNRIRRNLPEFTPEQRAAKKRDLKKLRDNLENLKSGLLALGGVAALGLLDEEDRETALAVTLPFFLRRGRGRRETFRAEPRKPSVIDRWMGKILKRQLSSNDPAYKPIQTPEVLKRSLNAKPGPRAREREVDAFHENFTIAEEGLLMLRDAPQVFTATGPKFKTRAGANRELVRQKASSPHVNMEVRELGTGEFQVHRSGRDLRPTLNELEWYKPRSKEAIDFFSNPNVQFLEKWASSIGSALARRGPAGALLNAGLQRAILNTRRMVAVLNFEFEQLATGKLRADPHEPLNRKQLDNLIALRENRFLGKEEVLPIDDKVRAIDAYHKRIHDDLRVDAGPSETLAQSYEKYFNDKFSWVADMAIREGLAFDVRLNPTTQTYWPRAFRSEVHNPPAFMRWYRPKEHARRLRRAKELRQAILKRARELGQKYELDDGTKVEFQQHHVDEILESYRKNHSNPWFNRRLDELTNRKNPNLERHRLLDVDVGIEWDPAVVNQRYFTPAIKRLMMTNEFGVNLGRAKELLKIMDEQGYDTDFVVHLFNVASGNNPAHSRANQLWILNEISAATSIETLGASQLVQMISWAKTAEHVPVKKAVVESYKELADTWLSHAEKLGVMSKNEARAHLHLERRRQIVETGAALEADFAIAFSNARGLFPKLASLYLRSVQVLGIDRSGRRMQAVAGRSYMRTLLAEWEAVRRSGQASKIADHRAKLHELIEDPGLRQILEKPRLTEGELKHLELNAAANIVARSSGRTESIDLPLMAQHPFGAHVFKLRALMFRMGAETIRRFKTIRNLPPREQAKFVAKAVLAIGATHGLLKARDFIFGRDFDESAAQQFWDTMNYGGWASPFIDAVDVLSVRFGTEPRTTRERILGIIAGSLGPTYERMVEGPATVMQMIETESTDPLYWYFRRRTPEPFRTVFFPPRRKRRSSSLLELDDVTPKITDRKKLTDTE